MSETTVEQSRQQAAQLLAAAQEHVAQEQQTITRLKGELAAAYNRRDEWAAEVRRLTPIKRTRKAPATEGGGSNE